MKIFKDGELVAEMPTKPKNLDCGCRGGVVSVVVDNKDVILGKYASQQRASEVMSLISKAYLADEERFDLPKE